MLGPAMGWMADGVSKSESEIRLSLDEKRRGGAFQAGVKPLSDKNLDGPASIPLPLPLQLRPSDMSRTKPSEFAHGRSKTVGVGKAPRVTNIKIKIKMRLSSIPLRL